MSSVAAETKLVLRPALAGTLMTPEEFDAVEDAEDLHVYELIHGVLVVSPPPSEGERGPNEWLGYLLLRYRETHPKGSALDLTLPEHAVHTADSRRRADRVIWCGLGRRPKPRRDKPTIVVEFVSEGKRNRRRDYEEKRDEYLGIGIEEYWLIDRFRRTMTVFRNRPRGPEMILVREKGVYRTTLLPGFDLRVGELLAVADTLEPNGVA
jgi:Uma2 family endonuclease